MAFLDIVLGLLLAYGLFKGFMNGLFVEIASILALVLGLFGAFHFSDRTAQFLQEEWNWNPQYMNVIAFLITFFLIVIGVQLLGKLLTKLADVALLGLLNKMAGAVFGLLKVAVLLGALLVFFERADHAFHFLDEATKEASILYGPLQELGAVIFGSVFPEGETSPTADDFQYL